MVSDASLLGQLQTGDDAAFDVIFERHYERIYGVLYRLLGNRADAEDVAQQVFLKLYRSPQRVRGGADLNLVGWLYRVAMNAGYNTIRSRKRRHHWSEQFARQWWPFSSASDPAQLAAARDDQDRVRLVLGQMKDRDAKLLLLRHSGLAYKEIAAALGVAPSSVGSLLTRAERTFRKQYQQAFPDLVDGG